MEKDILALNILESKTEMTLFEKIIKGTGSLEKDMIKVSFQFIEMLYYIAMFYYLFNSGK